MLEKIYKYESRGLKMEGTKEQILVLYNLIHYENSIPSYLRDLLGDIETDFPIETGIE